MNISSGWSKKTLAPVVSLVCFGLFIVASQVVFADKGKPVKQRQINEVAAGLEECTRTIIDNTGLRYPKESLPDYIKRLMGVLPNESASLRAKRMKQYITVLDVAAIRLATLAKQPALTDLTVDNLSYWSRISHVGKYLPGRVVKVKLAWKADQKHTVVTLLNLQKEMLETVQHVVAALTAIRNCKP